MASGDVLYDLAFLLMDLVERGLGTAANIVFNRYLAETARDEDLDALAALPLFLSMRAAIRAKVTAAKLRTCRSRATRRRSRQSARDYFALARRFIAPPAAAADRGRRAVGHRQDRCWRARSRPTLAPSPGAVVLRSDVMRKRLFGADETDKLPDARPIRRR